jgi:peptidoglycan hydrolase-like protein with peptidoglycan-binding domain
MTKQEIIGLQMQLNKLGYGPLEVDGQYGKNTKEAYAKYLDDLDPETPTVVPPPDQKWWMSKALIGGVATILVGIVGIFGYQLDSQVITEIILSTITVVTGVISVLGTLKRKAPIDTKYINPFNQPAPLKSYDEIKPYADPRGAFSDN